MNVYVNRTINLKKIKAIGFDMDYTLVRYNTRAFEELTFFEAIKKLIARKNYPEIIKALTFDFDLSIQGLVIDKMRGNLLKVSRFGKVKEAYFGKRPLPFSKQKSIYSNRIIDLSAEHFQSLDTSFSLSNGILFAELVELKKLGHALPDYYQLANDIRETIDYCHSDGSLKGEVERNFSTYIYKDPKVAELLELYKKNHKKLILITNSDYTYTNNLLNFALTPSLKNHKSWQDLFDITITSARKPSFFTTPNPFLKIDPQSGLMSNMFGPIKEGIYQGGFAGNLQHDLNLQGEEILYLGDHIYGDVVSIKKTFNWRTALVLDPLADEVFSIKKSAPIQEAIDLQMKNKKEREEKIFAGDQSPELFEQIDTINEEIKELLKKYRQCFNPYWGELMRAGLEESRMADQVEKYACLYMAQVSDLLPYGAKNYFRPLKRVLPHEILS